MSAPVSASSSSAPLQRAQAVTAHLCAAATAGGNDASSSSGAHPQSATRLLMVSPLHFRRNDESAADNSFMLQLEGLSHAEVQARAQAEFDEYVALLRSRGIGVEVHLPRADVFTPDGVFPNNWFSTHAAEATPQGRKESLLLLYPMRHRTRQLERDPRIVASLASRYDRLVDFTAEEEVANASSMLEGTGAAIFDHAHRTLYHAISERSTVSLAQRVAAAIWPSSSGGAAPRVVSFHTRDAQSGTPLYHTNVMLAIGARWAVLCADVIPDAAERAALIDSLAQGGHEVILISSKQVAEFCGNILEVRAAPSADGFTPERRFVVMSSRAHAAFTPAQRETLTRLGGELLHTPLTTIEHIGGGGARCMIAELY